MVDPVLLAAFIPAAIALNLSPGADMMFCLGQGVRSGPRAAIASSAGISAGALVHTALAGAGLGALVETVPFAFEIIRWVGVIYLLWLAVHALRNVPAAGAVPDTAKHAFQAGLLVNLTNPKVILFVLAFVPQFVSPAAGPIFAQFMVFGAILALGGFFINGAVGVFAGGVGARIASGGRVLRYFSAGVFGALAARLAILERT